MDIEIFIEEKCKNKKNDEYKKALWASYEKYKHLTDKSDMKKELDKARIRYDEGYSMYDELADVIILYHILHDE